MNKFIRSIQQTLVGVCAIVFIHTVNATDLADQPLAVSRNVAGNVALALSVEFPTALGSAYTTAYAATNTYLGYFNPDMCYDYRTDAALANDAQPDVRHYFMPSDPTTDHTCKSKWSGNFLNWALTQTIDPFRFALTGGYRVVDEVGLTILEKAYASGQGGTVATPTIYDNADLISKSTPFNVKNITIRIGKAGTSFIISTCDPKAPEHVGTRPNPNDNTKTIAKPSCVDYINTVKTAKDVKPAIPAISSDKDIALINPVADTAIPTTVGDNEYYALHAAVRVCVPEKKLRESHCVQYGEDYKPEGLIQKNALKLNFAAFGYAVTDQRDTVHVNNVLPQNGDIDGGVLRAKMRPLGPMKSVPNAPNATNSRPEWDPNTGIFYKNPDPDDAAASGVSNSGVINYLNKFGKIYGDANGGKGYKRLDPVGELYYTALRYFKNLGPVASYSSNLTAEMKDDFPVITDWSEDPVSYECQKQFIIGVGDTNSWLDASLPGSTITTKEGHAIPPEVDADKTIDVKLATNQVGLMQDGTTNLGELFQSNSRYNTFFIAGMAYDAHTKDIRPGDKFPGDQTITTYWLDVLESGFIAANRNQYYLAAKFGGFEVPTGYDPYAANPKALTQAQWDTNKDGDPDNYYRANNPALMIKGLNAAFADAVKKASGASSVLSMTSASVVSGNLSYGSSFVVKDGDIDVWTGEVTAKKIAVDGAGNISQVDGWSASPKLEAKTAIDGWMDRVMATAKCEVNDTVTLSQICEGVKFTYDTISADMQKAIVDANRLNYLRGQRSNEPKDYRARKQILGDIVNSQVVAVGSPSAPYTDTFNKNYSGFVKANASRKTVVYVGGNDGFLHAFDGSETGGDELFAFAPNALFNGPNNTPMVDGLAALANISFVHHYYVDSTPVVQDVNYSTSLDDWHTLLIGGLGKGGKAYYCLDVTNPSAFTKDGVAGIFKWEFKNANLGYTYGQPAIVKVKLANGSKKWVVIVTSGYNNADRQGHFFILDPATGSLIQDIPTGEVPGKDESEAGLSQVTAYVADKRDWTADAAYAADLKGNVWRLDLTGTKNALGSYAKPTKIISVGQPITVPPVVEVDQTTLKRYVFVGTGKLLAINDINTSQDNAIYVFNDGSNVAFYDGSTTPVAFPWTKSNLVLNADVTAVSTNQPSTVLGYYIPLGSYRVNIPMRSAGGFIVVGANIPTGDVCNPEGKGRLYAFSYGTGASALVGGSGPNGEKQTLSYQSSDVAIGGVGLVKDSAGNLRISANIDQSLKIYDLNQGGTGGVILLNWRELPTNN